MGPEMPQTERFAEMTVPWKYREIRDSTYPSVIQHNADVLWKWIEEDGYPIKVVWFGIYGNHPVGYHLRNERQAKNFEKKILGTRLTSY